MPPNIYSFIRAAKLNYTTDEITIVDGYDYSQYKVLQLCELYSNSKYLNGQTDTLGRIKPFYNIVNRLVTLSDTAEDIDRKDIVITTDDAENYVKAFMFTKENQRWMEKANFGQTLNDMTHTRGKYGGVMVKKTEGKDLNIDVVDWRNLITDQTNVRDGIKIERHFYTPAQLLKKGKDLNWDMEAVNEAISTALTNQNSEGFDHRPTPTPYIEIYEAHGVFPKNYYDESEPDDEYEERVFICANVDTYSEGQGEDKTITEKGNILFSEVEDESPYKYLPYEKVPGRGLGRGRIELGFESQQWTNDTVLKQKDIMDLAAKTVIVTDDAKFGRNLLRDKEVGDVVKLSPGRTATQLQLTPQSLQFMGGLMEQWNTQIERAASTYAANTGDSLPAGTPYRLGAILNQEANSIFNDRRDEMGIFIGEIYRDWVLPYLKKQLTKEHTLVSDFDMDELRTIDDSFVNYQVKSKFLDILFETKSMDRALERMPMLEQEAREKITQTKSKRFLDIPEGYYDDIEFDLEVQVTNEKKMKAAYLETLSSILTTVTNTFDPQTGTFRVLEDPKLSKLFGQIMETAGYSPVELQGGAQAQTSPIQMQGVPGTGTEQFAPEAIGAGNEEMGFAEQAMASNR